MAAHVDGSRAAGGGVRPGRRGTGPGRGPPRRVGGGRKGPPPPLGAVAVYPEQFAGEREAEKLERIRAEIARLGADALVLSDSHAVAWTFNIRGADVSHTPLPLSYALVPKDGRPQIFIDHRKLSNSARSHLEASGDVKEPEELTSALRDL